MAKILSLAQVMRTGTTRKSPNGRQSSRLGWIEGTNGYSRKKYAGPPELIYEWTNMNSAIVTHWTRMTATAQDNIQRTWL